MEAKQYRVEPFPGWDAIRAEIRRLGAGQVLRWCLAKAWSGSEEGIDLDLHPQTLHPIVRACIRIAEDERLDVPEIVRYTPAWEARVRRLLRELASEAHIELIESKDRHLTSKKYRRRRSHRTSWVATLQMRHRHDRADCEVGRTALHLREYWKEANERATGRRQSVLEHPIDGNGEKLEGHVALALCMQVAKGFAATAATLFANTRYRDSHEAILVPPYVRSASDVAGTWACIEKETRGSLRNVFLEAPIVRLHSGALIAADPATLFGALQARILRRTGFDYYASDRDSRRAGRTLKYSFENLVSLLVRECASSSSETYVPAFELVQAGDRTDSPDAHLVGQDGVVLFEAKGLRLDEPPDASLEELHKLMSAAAGFSATRPRLEQGSRFLKKWVIEAASDAILNLGVPRGVQYVIVVPFNWPDCIHRPAFRDDEWRTCLGATERDLDHATSFVSDRDLEILGAVLKALSARGCPSTAWRLIRQWRRAHEMGPHGRIIGDRLVILGGLGEYLIEKYRPEVASASFIRVAADQMFADAAEFLFEKEALREGDVRLRAREALAKGI